MSVQYGDDLYHLAVGLLYSIYRVYQACSGAAGVVDDGEGREACHRHLLDSALDAVRISNPQHLARRGIE